VHFHSFSCISTPDLGSPSHDNGTQPPNTYIFWLMTVAVCNERGSGDTPVGIGCGSVWYGWLATPTVYVGLNPSHRVDVQDPNVTEPCSTHSTIDQQFGAR